MVLVGEVFEDHMIARAPVIQLLDRIIFAPDRQELSRLAQVLEGRLLHEYEQHGREVLTAAHTLGVDLFLVAMKASAEFDWAAVQRAFEQYPQEMSEQSRRGLLLMLLENLDYHGLPPSTLERIARHESVFRVLVPVLLESDREKLFEILAQDQVLSIVEKGYAQYPDVMNAFVETWRSRTWMRYERESRFQALFSLVAYRMEARSQSAGNFAEEISDRDELSPIYEDVGLDGVKLWDAYVTPSTGDHQRNLAQQAISLYKAGYPLDDLSEQGGLALAAFYNRFPLDLKLYNLFKPLGDAAYLAVVLFALVMVAVPLLLFVKVGRRFVWARTRKSSQGGEGLSAQSRHHEVRAGTNKQEKPGPSLLPEAAIDDETNCRHEQNNQGTDAPRQC